MPSLDFPAHFHIREQVSLSDYTTLKVGGAADYLAEVIDQTQLIELYRYCRNYQLRFLAIGDGTNIFFPESGFRGLVAVLRFDKIASLGKQSVVVEAGATLKHLVQFAIDNSLSGLEFATGIPGTVGGAIYGNAGAYGSNVGELLTRAKVLTQEGKLAFVDRDYFRFAYRYSGLKTNPAIVLQAEFQLDKGDNVEIKRRCDEIITIRNKKLPPPEIATAGSWFKNLKDKDGGPIAAARYLDAVGSKQTKVGDAAVYIKHANIFYNRGHATASDMLKLERELQQRVQREFGIRLEREVMYID